VEIDRYSDVPPWRQLADELRRQISDGEIAPRRPIPSKKTLMQTYGIAGATCDKAVNLLKEEGLVRTIIGMGIYVVPREDWPAGT
jgi:DNA-binding GntR family transcriptional regulator